MCQIIYVPPNGFFPWIHLEAIYENNPDGFGMMWTENGKVKHIKGLFDRDEIFYMIDDGPKTGVAYHFRYTTRGLTNDDNCHPFIISDDLGMMHNGTIPNIKDISKLSDTAQFAMACRNVHANNGTDFFFSDTFKKTCTETVGSSNRVLFLGVGEETGKRRVSYINGDKWVSIKRDGRECFMANEYSLVKGYRDKKWSSDLIYKGGAYKKQKKRKNLHDMDQFFQDNDFFKGA